MTIFCSLILSRLRQSLKKKKDKKYLVRDKIGFEGSAGSSVRHDGHVRTDFKSTGKTTKKFSPHHMNAYRTRVCLHSIAHCICETYQILESLCVQICGTSQTITQRTRSSTKKKPKKNLMDGLVYQSITFNYSTSLSAGFSFRVQLAYAEHIVLLLLLLLILGSSCILYIFSCIVFVDGETAKQ